MKTSTLVLTFTLLAGAAVAEPPTVSVQFGETERFTDFSSSYSNSDRSRDHFIKELATFIERRAADRLGAGQRLEVVITDVDMAGEFEPWRRSGGYDVRIVKDLYPPRIDLSFRLLGADGEVLAEGNRKLRDLGFMYTGRPMDSDPLRHEKRLLDRWVASELRHVTRT